MNKFTFKHVFLSLFLLVPWVIVAETEIREEQPSIVEETDDIVDFLSSEELDVVLRNHKTTYAYMPEEVVTSLRTVSKDPQLLQALSELLEHIASPTSHIAPYDITIEALDAAVKLNIPDDVKTVLENYKASLDSGDAAILLAQDRSRRQKIVCSLIVKECFKARSLSVSGNAHFGADVSINGELDAGVIRTTGGTTINGDLTVTGTIRGQVSAELLAQIVQALNNTLANGDSTNGTSTNGTSDETL